MEPRIVGIPGLHLLGALLFSAVAVRNVIRGDPVNAVLQGVLAVLIVMLGIGIARTA